MKEEDIFEDAREFQVSSDVSFESVANASVFDSAEIFSPIVFGSTSVRNTSSESEMNSSELERKRGKWIHLSIDRETPVTGSSLPKVSIQRGENFSTTRSPSRHIKQNEMTQHPGDAVSLATNVDGITTDEHLSSEAQNYVSDAYTSEAYTSEAYTSEAYTSDTNTSDTNTSDTNTSDTNTNDTDTNDTDTNDTDTNDTDTNDTDTNDTDTNHIDTNVIDTSDIDTSDTNMGDDDMSDDDMGDDDMSDDDSSDDDMSDDDSSDNDMSDSDWSDSDVRDADMVDNDLRDGELSETHITATIAPDADMTDNTQITSSYTHTHITDVHIDTGKIDSFSSDTDTDMTDCVMADHNESDYKGTDNDERCNDESVLNSNNSPSPGIRSTDGGTIDRTMSDRDSFDSEMNDLQDSGREFDVGNIIDKNKNNASMSDRPLRPESNHETSIITGENVKACKERELNEQHSASIESSLGRTGDFLLNETSLSETTSFTGQQSIAFKLQNSGASNGELEPKLKGVSSVVSQNVINGDPDKQIQASRNKSTTLPIHGKVSKAQGTLSKPHKMNSPDLYTHCNECQKSYKTSRSWKEHWLKHIQNNDHCKLDPNDLGPYTPKQRSDIIATCGKHDICKICGFILLKEGRKRFDQITDLGNKHQHCSICLKTYKMSNNLNKHILDDHRDTYAP